MCTAVIFLVTSIKTLNNDFCMGKHFVLSFDFSYKVVIPSPPLVRVLRLNLLRIKI
jgi:hypothetical protein